MYAMFGRYVFLMKLYLFRFPSELRRSGFGDFNWETNLLFPVYQMAGPRAPNNSEGATPGT